MSTKPMDKQQKNNSERHQDDLEGAELVQALLSLRGEQQ
jgi:hypothetical protein